MKITTIGLDLHDGFFITQTQFMFDNDGTDDDTGILGGTTVCFMKARIIPVS